MNNTPDTQKDEIYLVVMESGFAGAVVVCDPVDSDVEKCIRQLRSGGRKVRVFRDRESYLAFLDKDYAERHEQARRMRVWL